MAELIASLPAAGGVRLTRLQPRVPTLEDLYFAVREGRSAFAEGNRLALRCVKTELGEAGADGRRQFRAIAGSEHDIPCGMVIAAVVATLLGIITARPLLGSFDQAFQYIQEYTGFFTPGIVVIFMLGLFWKRANEAGAIAAAVGSFALSIVLKLAWPELPFMDRVGLVFLLALALAVIVSLTMRASADPNRIRTDDVSYATSGTFNAGAVGVIAILFALYASFW